MPRRAPGSCSGSGILSGEALLCCWQKQVLSLMPGWLSHAGEPWAIKRLFQESSGGRGYSTGVVATLRAIISVAPAPSHITLMTRLWAGYAPKGLSPAQGTAQDTS